MDELKCEHLTDVQGKTQADLLKAYFLDNGIEVEIFQESVGQHIYPTTLDILANAQIFVAKEDVETARQLLNEYNDLDEDIEEETENE